MTKIYKSKKDLWVVLVVWGAVLLVASTFFTSSKSIFFGNYEFFPLVGQLLGVVLPLWTLFGTYYKVGVSQIYIRSGPFFWRVQIDQIHEIGPSKSGASSPALSLDRVLIVYGSRKNKILVSPESSQEFIKDVTSKLQKVPR